MSVRVKRVYEKPHRADGMRILVDRLWPRGLKKEDAQVDLWLKDVAPSADLRKWFGHDPDKWSEFKARYFAELRERAEEVARLRSEAEIGVVTLLFSAKDEQHNNAVALQEYLSHL
jgi:uncharacterized protein YeaO (DUF488 family)